MGARNATPCCNHGSGNVATPVVFFDAGKSLKELLDTDTDINSVALVARVFQTNHRRLAQ